MKEFDSEFYKKKGIKFIQFHFTTIFGELKIVEFPAQNWEEMKNGTGVDGSSLGFLSTEQSDMRIKPDLDTFSVLPWDQRVGRFICDLFDNNGISYPTCPRALLKKVMKKAENMGFNYATRPELEWYFLNEDLDPADLGSYMSTTPDDFLQELRREISVDMLEMFNRGSPQTIHHEVGPGQHEIELSKLNALFQADNVQTGKLIIKTEAFFEDILSTFMPKPFDKESGSGLHIHIYLDDKDGNNVFAEKDGISDTLKFFVGGIIKHADAICVILNPSINSYKRLVPNHEAPVYKAWGVGNRTPLIRVPGYESKAHIEYRAGDGAMNIYLGQAVLLAAGLDGIENKIDPNTPTTKNVDHLSDVKRKELGIGRLPGSLSESLDAYKNSQFMKELLGEELFNVFLKKKLEEIEEYNIAVKNGNEDDWEIAQYIDC